MPAVRQAAPGSRRWPTSSSGTTTARGSTSQPASRSASTRAGPAVSSRSPAAERFEQVTTTASCVAAARLAGVRLPPTRTRCGPLPSRAARPARSRCRAAAPWPCRIASAPRRWRRSAPPSRPRCEPWPSTSARMATVPAARSGVSVHLHPVQRQRMAERDQVGGALGGADAGQPRHAEGIALRAACVHQRAPAPPAASGPWPRATARRAVTGLPPTSTMRASPLRTKVARLHAIAPSRSASYVCPASAAGSPSGTTSRALALAIGRSCDEACPPAGRASSPSAPRARRTRR